MKFAKYLINQGINEKTARQYECQANIFLNEHGIKKIEDFDNIAKENMLALAQEFCMENKRIPIRRYALQYMFKFFKKKDYCNDFKEMIRGKVKIPPRKKLEKALTIDEFKKLLEGVPKNYNLMLRIMFWGALRGSEVLSLKRKSISVVDKRMRLSIVGKGNKRITIFLPMDLSKELVPYINEVCQGDKNKKLFDMAYITFYMRLRGFGKEILNKSISTHTVKHTRSQFEFNRGTPLDQIKEILHHEDIKTTLKYKSEVGIDSRKAVEERENELEI